MSKKNSYPRQLAVLRLPRSVPKLIITAVVIVERMTANPAFVSPVPSLAEVAAAITGLQAAQVDATTRAMGAAAKRNAAKVVLVGLLQRLEEYVQSVADGNPAYAPSIIMSAGLDVRKSPVVAPRVFGAKKGRLPGDVIVFTKSLGARTAYVWQYSVDGGVTWVTLPITVEASTRISGLTPLTTVLLRYRTATKDGESGWSKVISLLVM
jgi:hypothetical protein